MAKQKNQKEKSSDLKGKSPRTVSRTAQFKKRFLEKYQELAAIGQAARESGISRRQVYNWLETDSVFAASFESAKQECLEGLEREARRRACDGWDEPVFYRGELQGTVRKYSDTLLIVLLKANAPEKYRERFEHTGKDGAPLAPPVINVITPEAQKTTDAIIKGEGTE